ncbi:MAG: hypothetical protein RLY86_1027 [Pseudomonadota bacterium]|jgi:tetratricopeptide (TPR) repeat protein
MAGIEEMLAVAVAEHRAGRTGTSVALYRRVLAIDPDNANALHLLGLTERQAGRRAAAIALVRRALARMPDLLDARLNLANMLREDGDLPGARAQWKAVLAADPAHAAALFLLATHAAGQGGAGRSFAIAAMRRVLRLAPTMAEAHNALGLFLRQEDQVDAAIACQRNAIAHRPGFLPAWMNLGNALLDAGDTVGAVRALRTALAILPDSPECWFNLGNAHYRTADLDAALACYRRSEMLGLGVARARVVAVLVEQGQDAAAEAALGRYLPLDGTDVATCIELLHQMLVRAGRQAEARHLFTRLAGVPLAGRVYPVECRTALAALDLAEGDAAAAVARLDGIRSDNCWFFTVRSLAALRRSLEERGAGQGSPGEDGPGEDGPGLHGSIWDRPANPDPTRPRLTSSTLGNRGRFAHNALEYVLLRLYAEKHGCTLETPDWVGGAFFDLDDPRPAGPLPSWPFGRHVLNGLLTGERQSPPVVDRDVLSPLFLFDYKIAYRDRVWSWLRPRACWSPWIAPAVAALRAGGRTVVAIHIRRGDFLHYGYPVTETGWYVDWLHDLWPTLDRPVLYLASDDLPAVRQAFAAFAPVTVADVAPPWPGLDYLQDFHVLTQADIVGISAASGFSQLAARLNDVASLCVQPDVEAGRIRPFIPWT